MEAVNIIGEKLREFKEKHGLSSAAMAKMLGISEAFMSQILSGKRIGRRKVLDFAQRLGVPAEALVGREPQGITVKGAVGQGGTIEITFKAEKIHLPTLNPNTTYALRIKTKCPPYYQTGDIIFVKKTPIIKEGDKVIMDAGLSQKIYLVAMIDKNLVILKDIEGRMRVLERKDREYDKVICHISI